MIHWPCPKCNTNNADMRGRCRDCGTARPDGAEGLRLKPRDKNSIAYSEIFRSNVALCEDAEGKLWFCFEDGQGRWNKEEEATPEMIAAFNSGSSVENALRWEPEVG